MAISAEARATIRALVNGTIPPSDESAIKAMAEAFKENPASAKALVGKVPKEHLEKAMKVADIPSRKIGDILYDDPLDRAEFFRKEQTRARCIGKPGFDEHGYPTGFGLKDPFAPGVTAESLGLDRRRGTGLEMGAVAMKSAEGIRNETDGDWRVPEDLPWDDVESGPKPKGGR